MSRLQLATMLGAQEQNILQWEQGKVDPCGRAVAMLTRLAPDGGARLLTALCTPVRQAGVVGLAQIIPTIPAVQSSSVPIEKPE